MADSSVAVEKPVSWARDRKPALEEESHNVLWLIRRPLQMGIFVGFCSFYSRTDKSPAVEECYGIPRLNTNKTTFLMCQQV